MVQRLQAKGIKVLAYVSFGEEDGTIADVYDPSSGKVPWTGDGTGPGGYAAYYCKGGNHFGECSECSNDRQRMEGIKACSKARAEYYSGVGRCSKACLNDWREGYTTWREGGACSAGKTSKNFWVRDATMACSNTACPSFAPLHSGCPQYAPAENVWGQDFSIMTDFPDENGIWGSYYTDATNPAWKNRLLDFYFSAIFGFPVVYTEETCTISIHGGTVPVTRVDHYPIDPEEPVEVKHPGGYVYAFGSEVTFDAKLGTFRITPNGTSPALAAGDTVKISYTSLGLEADGVFMDTVDTVDVYPASAFQDAFATLINELKALYPTKDFCSNRGFTILEDIIASCSYVMFESFLTDYNWETGLYSKITNIDAIAFNDSVVTLLKSLRASNTFDVLALNYCANDSSGDELRAYIADTCRALGFLSWSSTILLNSPLPNTVFTSPSSVPYAFRTNDWRLARAKPVP